MPSFEKYKQSLFIIVVIFLLGLIGIKFSLGVVKSEIANIINSKKFETYVSNQVNNKIQNFADKDLTDEEKSEALSLIDKITALEISKGTKEELKEYKQDIDDGEFAHMDLRYLRALHNRLAK